MDRGRYDAFTNNFIESSQICTYDPSYLLKVRRSTETKLDDAVISFSCSTSSIVQCFIDTVLEVLMSTRLKAFTIFRSCWFTT